MGGVISRSSRILARAQSWPGRQQDVLHGAAGERRELQALGIAAALAGISLVQCSAPSRAAASRDLFVCLGW